MSLAAAHSARIPRAASGTNPKIRVMLVDDSMVARTVARRALATAPEVEVVASVGNGKIAVDTIVDAAPDVVVLDIEMPIINGIEALPHLLKRRPGLKVIIASTLSDRNAEITLKAPRAGAADVLLKPSAQDGVDAAKNFGEALKRKVLDFGAAAAAAASRRRPVTQTMCTVSRPTKRHAGRPRVVAIGSSTGGPDALAQTLQDWAGRKVRQPVFITQHMPPTFTRVLAEHLSRTSGAVVAEGIDGEVVVDGRIYIAPGGFHMLIEAANGGARIRLDPGPEVNFCRPAVDPMFKSLVATYGGDILAAVLTGMGRDGAQGAGIVQAAGGQVIIQDEASSVVWGMPGSVSRAGFADETLPLTEIGAKLADIAGGVGR